MDGGSQGVVRVGVGGWTYAPWRGTFFPDKLRQKDELPYMAEHLPSVEVNGTFYRALKPEVFAGWHDQTPDDFVFSLKAPRYATNHKDLAESASSIDRFLTSGITELKQKLGPINWQFPETKAFDPDNFETFLKLLPKEQDRVPLRHAVEVRHPSFAAPEFAALLQAHGVAPVIAADSSYPQIADPAAPFVYARIMGTTEDEPAGYSDHALDTWADRIIEWSQGRNPDGITYLGQPEATKARDVFLYVISGHKVRNPQAALGLVDRLRQRGVQVRTVG